MTTVTTPEKHEDGVQRVTCECGKKFILAETLALHKTYCKLLDKGASAVEYGLMVAAIAAVVVGTVFALGTMMQSAFHKTCVAIAVSGTHDDPATCDGTAPAVETVP
jgi:pilus assembly protein Flp/PilA